MNPWVRPLGRWETLALMCLVASPLRAQSAGAAPQQPSAATPQVSAGRVLQTVRHTLVATVGAVTQAALSSPSRLAPERADRVTPDGPVLRWRQQLEVRGNVPVRVALSLMSDVAVGSRGRWSVRLTDGRVVSLPVGVEPAMEPVMVPVMVPELLAPGRHLLELRWETVRAEARPPQLRVQSIPVEALPGGTSR